MEILFQHIRQIIYEIFNGSQHVLFWYIIGIVSGCAFLIVLYNLFYRFTGNNVLKDGQILYCPRCGSMGHYYVQGTGKERPYDWIVYQKSKWYCYNCWNIGIDVQNPDRSIRRV